MVARNRSAPSLAAKAGARFVAGLVVLSALLFVPAGTLDWWQAWLYLASLFLPMAMVFMFLLRRDPALLERRLRSGEKERDQSLVVRLGSVFYLLAFVLPGLDRRMGWSHVDPAISWVAAGAFVTAYGLFVLVLRENSFASRVVEVDASQTVITTGPYAVVRHPMYTAILGMMLVTPVVLGSWWSALIGLPLVGVFVIRIHGEERVLSGQLPGYRDYLRQTKYRLVPGIW